MAKQEQEESNTVRATLNLDRAAWKAIKAGADLYDMEVERLVIEGVLMYFEGAGLPQQALIAALPGDEPIEDKPAVDRAATAVPAQ